MTGEEIDKLCNELREKLIEASKITDDVTIELKNEWNEDFMFISNDPDKYPVKEIIKITIKYPVKPVFESPE